MKQIFLSLGISGLALVLALAASARPARPHASNAAGRGLSASAARGKEVFDKKCAICHFPDSEVKKIGPGLKGLFKRGKFTVNGNKVTADSVKTWIENGDSLMPPMKETLEPAQIKDVVAYVKTL